ncbi:hypothetical protein H4Q26_006479 [Puccinia striiformis f. sp. tritici PST-130]|nr:hypothetical protein H4Q26_006479 [Puccinia striiformis f. sp. tritici PST-130]
MLSTPTNSVLILSHPDILEFIDGGETDSAVYIITEQISSLSVKLDRLKMTKQTEVEWKIWGLSRISALKFLNGPGTYTHGNLKLTSIFISESGEWKLSVLKALGGLFPEAARYASPELMKTGYEVLKELDPACLDSSIISNNSKPIYSTISLRVRIHRARDSNEHVHSATSSIEITVAVSLSKGARASEKVRNFICSDTKQKLN